MYLSVRGFCMGGECRVNVVNAFKFGFVGALGARPPAAKTFLERKVLDSKEL